jgi:hypothetical protein
MQCYAFAVLCAMLMQELGRCAMLCYAVRCARLMQWLVVAVQCLCVAMCSVRLWQGLRFAVLF